MDPIKYTAHKLLEKNKLLFLFCILFIMTSLFLTCYVFFRSEERRVGKEC